MDKRTKLITIEYDEYLDLLQTRNQREKEVCFNQIELLNNFKTNNHVKGDMLGMINMFINYYKNKISILEGDDYENRG